MTYLILYLLTGAVLSGSLLAGSFRGGLQPSWEAFIAVLMAAGLWPVFVPMFLYVTAKDDEERKI